MKCGSYFGNFAQVKNSDKKFMHTNFMGERINITCANLLPSPLEKGWG